MISWPHLEDYSRCISSTVKFISVLIEDIHRDIEAVQRSIDINLETVEGDTTPVLLFVVCTTGLQLFHIKEMLYQEWRKNEQ